MPGSPNVYVGELQLQSIYDILNTTTVKNALDIPLTIKKLDGTDTGETNPDGVMIETPFALMTNFLPQVFVTIGNQTLIDEQFDTASMITQVQVYYARTFGESEVVVTTMISKLQYIAKELLKFRTDQTHWYSMTFPTIEVENEVNTLFQTSQENIKIAVGRVSLELLHKGFYSKTYR